MRSIIMFVLLLAAGSTHAEMWEGVETAPSENFIAVGWLHAYDRATGLQRTGSLEGLLFDPSDFSPMYRRMKNRPPRPLQS